MTTRYRVEYALKSHRRDQFIEWIKALLATPFVLYSAHGIFETQGSSLSLEHMAEEAARRYSEIFRDVEKMIDDHIALQNADSPFPSKLKLLVPTIGPFFTRLPLETAFKYQDRKRFISSRRFVSPSFNDVRLILNSAQIMAVTTYSSLNLITLDGDLTLYDDGQNLEADSPVIQRILELLTRNVMIGIVTAAGYSTADRYYARLHGLLDALVMTTDLTPAQKNNFVVMGGEANYLFAFDPSSPHLLSPVPRSAWLTPEMAAWSEEDITSLLDVAEVALRDCIKRMNVPAVLTRKDRAVGMVPSPTGAKIPREVLEETVLTVQKVLELSSVGREARVPFCAFNGSRDIFVDVGSKKWGCRVVQRYFSKHGAGGASSPQSIGPENTLHIGDQFLSAGANDFKARTVATTAWVASPDESEQLLSELLEFMEKKMS